MFFRAEMELPWPVSPQFVTARREIADLLLRPIGFHRSTTMCRMILPSTI
jgi:hypothetical protein